MKINQIIVETSTTAGVVATVSKPLGGMQTRPDVRGLKSIDNLGKKKGPYANSLNEGAMKQLSMDLRGGADGLSDQEFQKKYKMTKQEARKELSSSRKEIKKPQPVSEAHLEEDDIVLVPGQGRKMKTGFVPHGQSRVDHEVEMARSDLLSAAKNAKSIYQMIESTSEDEGLQGWVQEKIIKANDYLNSVREYLEGKQSQGIAEAGGAKQYSAFKREWVAKHGSGAKVPGYDSKEYTSYCYRQHDKKQGVAEGSEQIYNILALDKGNALKKPTKLKWKASSLEDIFDALAAQDWYPLEINGVEVIAGKRLKQGVGEGAKVDRMVKHIEKSEKKLGKSSKEAENIAWATANKRGMLDNKNKKAK